MLGVGWAKVEPVPFLQISGSLCVPRALRFKHPLLEPSIKGSVLQLTGMKPILMLEPSFISQTGHRISGTRTLCTPHPPFHHPSGPRAEN